MAALQVYEMKMARRCTAPPMWSMCEKGLQIKRSRARVDSIELSIKTSSNIRFPQTSFNPLSIFDDHGDSKQHAGIPDISNGMDDCTSALELFSNVSHSGLALCQGCGIDLSANERLRKKNHAFKAENSILQGRLYESGQVNQRNEVYQRKLNSQAVEIQQLKDAVSNYKEAFAHQQETCEATKHERALLSQTLTLEVRNHEATERALEQERANIQDVLRFLHSIEVPRRANPDENASIGTIWIEKNDMEVRLEQADTKIKSLEEELQNTRDDLQHKRLLLEELSGGIKAEPRSAPVSPASHSSDEENETAVLLPRKRSHS